MNAGGAKYASCVHHILLITSLKKDARNNKPGGLYLNLGLSVYSKIEIFFLDRPILFPLKIPFGQISGLGKASYRSIRIFGRPRTYCRFRLNLNSHSAMNNTLSDKRVIIDLNKWKSSLPVDAKAYANAEPYPHIVFENFLETWAAEKTMREFPPVKDEGWIHYVHFNEKKHGLNKIDLLPPFVRQVIEELNTPEFLRYVSQLTGIDNLLADDMLEGGGLHQSLRGGFLNVHADFTVHPHKPNWRRRVNLLIYLNQDWKPEYRGDLELWDRGMQRCQQKIGPLFNRCVLFNTDEDSYHGLPDPIMCPEEMTRKSIALYYFTEEKVAPKKRSTNYQARPGDGWKAPFIYLDKKVLALYSRLKSTLGINDDFVSKVLRIFSSGKPRK